MNEMPANGGRYIRDPETGQLSPEPPQFIPAEPLPPAPSADVEVPVETKKGKL